MAFIEPMCHDQPNIIYILAWKKISLPISITQKNKYCYFGMKWLKFHIDLFPIFSVPADGHG